MQRTSFPLGIRLRLVPNKVSPKGIIKIKRSRYEQSVWLANIEHERYNGIELLDTKSKELTTLREQLMKIPSSKGDHSLFFSVNQHYKYTSSFVFTFRTEDSEEARYMIPAIYTYVTKSTKNKEYDKYFNDIARLHAKEFSWDEDSKTIINRDDDKIPEAATAADIIFFGLDKLMNYDEDSAKGATTTIDITNSSVVTYTTGKTENQLTGKFDDASTIASVNTFDSDTEDNDHTTSATGVHALKKDIIKLTNAVTLLNVNVKARDNQTQEILGKMTYLEKAVASTQQTNSGDTHIDPDEDKLPRTSMRSPRRD